MKKLVALMLGVAMCASLTACGGSKAPEEAAAVQPAATEAADAGNETAQSEGGKHFTIATDTAFRPFEYTNADGNFEGIDVDVFDEMEEVPDDEFLGNYDVLLLDWTERLKEATAERLANLEAINAFCENDATNNGIAVYFEQPVLMSQPDRRKIAKKVYIDGGYLEIIKAFGFGTHIPSYLKDE